MILQLWNLLPCMSCSEASSPALLNRLAVSRTGTLTDQHTTLLIKGSQPLFLNKIQQDQSLWLLFSCRARQAPGSVRLCGEHVCSLCLACGQARSRCWGANTSQNPSFLKLWAMHFFLVTVPSGSPYISWGKKLNICFNYIRAEPLSKLSLWWLHKIYDRIWFYFELVTGLANYKISASHFF